MTSSDSPPDRNSLSVTASDGQIEVYSLSSARNRLKTVTPWVWPPLIASVTVTAGRLASWPVGIGLGALSCVAAGWLVACRAQVEMIDKKPVTAALRTVDHDPLPFDVSNPSG